MVRGDLEFDSDQESGSEIASMQKSAHQKSVALLGSRIIRSGCSAAAHRYI
jgi:hypothetical protein